MEGCPIHSKAIMLTYTLQHDGVCIRVGHRYYVDNGNSSGRRCIRRVRPTYWELKRGTR